MKNVSKSRSSFSMVPKLLTKLRRKIEQDPNYKSLSDWITHQAEIYVGMDSKDINEDMVELEKEIEDLSGDMKSIKSELDKKKNKLETLKAEAQARKERKERQENKLEKFIEVADHKAVDTDYPDKYIGKSKWASADQIPDVWSRRTGRDKSELWAVIEESVF